MTFEKTLPLFAQFQRRQSCDSAGKPDGCIQTGLTQVQATESTLQSGLTIFFGTIAAIAVIVIIVAGIRYITAEGNPDKLAQARKSIIYALIGLVIALLAELVVRFVVGRI